jgi:hypothetical protein
VAVAAEAEAAEAAAAEEARAAVEADVAGGAPAPEAAYRGDLSGWQGLTDAQLALRLARARDIFAVAGFVVLLLGRELLAPTKAACTDLMCDVLRNHTKVFNHIDDGEPQTDGGQRLQCVYHSNTPGADVKGTARMRAFGAEVTPFLEAILQALTGRDEERMHECTLMGSVLRAIRKFVVSRQVQHYDMTARGSIVVYSLQPDRDYTIFLSPGSATTVQALLAADKADEQATVERYPMLRPRRFHAGPDYALIMHGNLVHAGDAFHDVAEFNDAMQFVQRQQQQRQQRQRRQRQQPQTEEQQTEQEQVPIDIMLRAHFFSLLPGEVLDPNATYDAEGDPQSRLYDRFDNSLMPADQKATPGR